MKLRRVAHDCFQWPETVLLITNFWFLNEGFPECAVHDPGCDADSLSASPTEKYMFQSLLHRIL